MPDEFEIIEAQKRIPSLSRKTDGFSRQDVVDAFQSTFVMIGGVRRLAIWANENPDKFYQLYAKLLPSTAIQINNNNIVQIEHAIPRTELDIHPEKEDPSGRNPE